MWFEHFRPENAQLNPANPVNPVNILLFKNRIQNIFLRNGFVYISFIFRQDLQDL